MKTIQSKPFKTEELIRRLQSEFPDYIIKKTWGQGGQIRIKKFTLTGNVGMRFKPEKGKATTQTNLDMAVLYLLFCWPISVYLFVKAKKIKLLEKEVIERLELILNESGKDAINDLKVTTE